MHSGARRKFAIGAVLIAVVVAAGFGLDHMRLRQMQSDVRRDIEGRGAMVQTDHSGRVTQIIFAVGDMQGFDLTRLTVFPHLNHLNFQGTSVTDDDLIEIARHRDLQVLNLVGTKVTDAGLRHLHGLRSLRTVDLRRTDVRSAGVRALKQAVPDVDPRVDRLRVAGLGKFAKAGGLGEIDENFDLTKLDLTRVSVTDFDMELLRGLKTLKMLNIGGAPVSDAGLRHLAELTNLEELWLSNTKVTNAGLDHLRGLKKLRAISLTNTAVTDEGVAVLAELPNLEVLHLGGTGLGDAALQHIRRLPRLRKLWLNQTQVTSTGLSALREALPETAIVGQAEPPPPLPEVETYVAPG